MHPRYIISYISAYLSSHPWCIHEVDSMHMHAIGVPRNVTNVKLRKTYPVELEPARGQEAQSIETRGDEGIVAKH
jgi:hypothetical protein